MKNDEFLHILDKLDILDARLDNMFADLAVQKSSLDKINTNRDRIEKLEDDVNVLGRFHTAVKGIVGFLTFLAGGVGLFEYFRK